MCSRVLSGCATDSLAEPSQAEFHFFTSDAHALPIVDVLMYDFAASIEKFGGSVQLLFVVGGGR